jgi:hypothetical protein
VLLAPHASSHDRDAQPRTHAAQPSRPACAAGSAMARRYTTPGDPRRACQEPPSGHARPLRRQRHEGSAQRPLNHRRRRSRTSASQRKGVTLPLVATIPVVRERPRPSAASASTLWPLCSRRSSQARSSILWRLRPVFVASCTFASGSPPTLRDPACS